MWKTINNDSIDLIDELVPFIRDKDIVIHIGTDAQSVQEGKTADFVTVVCIHFVGSGGRIFYKRDKKVSSHSLWEKLYNETYRSLEVAVLLTEVFGTKIADRILVHVDANPNTKYKSSDYVKQLAGMVLGYGFKYVLKPDAYVASHAADHIVKYKNTRK